MCMYVCVCVCVYVCTYVCMYKEGERALVTYQITERERAYIVASKASKASSTIVVKLVKVTNMLAKASSTQPLQSVIH